MKWRKFIQAYLQTQKHTDAYTSPLKSLIILRRQYLFPSKYNRAKQKSTFAESFQEENTLTHRAHPPLINPQHKIKLLSKLDDAYIDIFSCTHLAKSGHQSQFSPLNTRQALNKGLPWWRVSYLWSTWLAELGSGQKSKR